MMMITLLVLAALVVANVVVLGRMVRSGRPVGPPRSHPDEMFDPRIRV